MSSDTNKKNWIEGFKTVPTGNISDAMVKLGIADGVVQGLKPLSLEQARMVGTAFTVKQMQRHQEAEGYVLKHADVIDQQAAPGDVVVIDVGGRVDVCTGGAIMALRGKLRGLTGFVVDGAFRDIQDIIDLNFPVHCRGFSPVKSHPELETVGVNVPVLIGGVQVRPGDLIVADDTGMIVVPINRAQEVLEASLEVKDKEERVARYIRDGCSYPDAVRQSEDDMQLAAQSSK